MNGRGFEDRREEESPRQQRQRGLPTKLLFDGTEHAPILVDGSLARCSVQRSEARCPNRVPPQCPNYTGRLSHGGIVRSLTAATESLGLCPPSGRRPIRTTTAWRTSSASKKARSRVDHGPLARDMGASAPSRGPHPSSGTSTP